MMGSTAKTQTTLQKLPADGNETASPWLLGMTTADEQAYFEEYARSIYTGAGEIVDLGCWLGSTTIPLARGLAANPSAEARRKNIHAFDQFLWDPAMNSCVNGTDLEGKYEAEESFLEEFKRRIAPWADMIKIYAGDLRRRPWNDQDIEFLLIDAMKSWELSSAIVRNFYPSLIPQKSYVLHQDFAHSYTSWIHLIQYRLRDYFRFVHAVPHSQSFVFQYIDQIPRELFTTPYSASAFTEEEIEEAFEYSISLASDKLAQAAIALAKVRLFIHAGDRARAKFELEKYLSRGFPLVADLETVQAQLSNLQLPLDGKESRTSEREWLTGMTSREEQAYFEEYACSIYTGVGEIVDLGCWLGSTTIPLARGLAANPSRQASPKKIHAFDLFTWEAWMDDCVRETELESRYKPADSFLEEFKERTAPWADRIRIYPGDLCQLGWGDGPIEFLLIDAMKSWELSSAIVRNFYPSLIPMKSYVLHKDFAHWYTSWIHLIQYRLRDYFRFVQAIPHSSSFVFQYRHQIPRELVTTSYSASSFTEGEIEDAFDYSLSLASDKLTQARIASAKVMLFIHAGDRARASFELEKYLSRGFPLVADLQTVQEHLSRDS